MVEKRLAPAAVVGHLMSWERVEMAMAQRDVQFGDELHSRRLAAGLSLPALARMVHYSAGYLSKIENRHKRPTAELARQCDTALRAGGKLAVMVPANRAVVGGRRGAGLGDVGAAGLGANGGDEIWTISLAEDGSGAFLPVGRPEPTDASCGDLAGLAFLARGAATAARSDAALRYFRIQFDEIRKLGHTASPFVVLPIVAVKTQLLRAIAGNASGSPRRDMLCLAARYAEFAGWMAQECGDDRAASWW